MEKKLSIYFKKNKKLFKCYKTFLTKVYSLAYQYYISLCNGGGSCHRRLAKTTLSIQRQHYYHNMCFGLLPLYMLFFKL